MSANRYRNRNLVDAASAAGAAFGIHSDDAGQGETRAFDVRAVVAMVFGFGMLATVAAYLMS